MRRHAQREYLAEDIEQIRRFFPGATVIKALKTPFDLTHIQRNQKPRRTAQTTMTPTGGEKQVGIGGATCHPRGSKPTQPAAVTSQSYCVGRSRRDLPRTSQSYRLEGATIPPQALPAYRSTASATQSHLLDAAQQARGYVSLASLYWNRSS